MQKYYFVILLLLVFGCTLIQGKKEEKNAVAKANTNVLEIIQLFKSILNQALSKADLSSSVRGVLSSPLSIGATAISMLLGGIVLMAFYESPLSPLPVPPLPQPPVGRFPPENPIVPGINAAGGGRGGHHGSIQRQFQDSSSAMHFLNPEQFIFNHDHRRRMLYQPPLNQPHQFLASSNQKMQSSNNNNNINNYSSMSIKRSSNGDQNIYNYINQMAKNNLKPATSNNLDTTSTNYHTVVEQPLFDLTALPSSAQVNHLRKDTPSKNDNLSSSSSTNVHTFVAAPNDNNNNKNLNLNSALNPITNINNHLQPTTNLLNNLKNNLSNLNSLANSGNQLNLQQASPVYRPENDNNESRSFNDKVSLDHYAVKDAIKEQDFDQKQLVHSQLSQIEFKTSPELAEIEENLSNLKRSAERSA